MAPLERPRCSVSWEDFVKGDGRLSLLGASSVIDGAVDEELLHPSGSTKVGWVAIVDDRDALGDGWVTGEVSTWSGRVTTAPPSSTTVSPDGV